LYAPGFPFKTSWKDQKVLRQKLVFITGSLLLVLVALYVGVAVPLGTTAARTDFDPDALPYSAPGPHPVGTRDLAMAGETPLQMTIWYPALPKQGRKTQTRYPYAIKMGAPLGKVTVATFAGRAIRDAPPDRSADAYPLVILSPGFSIGASTYAWLAEHLASYGFVVIAPEHQEHMDSELNGLWQAAITRPQDIATVLAYIDEQVGSGRPLEGLIDTEMVAVVGHSYGGYTALAAGGAQIDTEGFEALCTAAYEQDDPNAWLCDELLPHLEDMAALAGLESIPKGLWQQAWSDPRVGAIVSLAGDALFFGQEGLAEIRVPVMAIGGTLDNDSAYLWGTDPTYEHASSAEKVRVALLDAEHMIFTGPCEAIPLFLRLVSGEFCSDSGWDRRYAHRLVKHFTTAFLLDLLKDDRSAHQALLPDAARFAGIEYKTTIRRPY
jgi:predicted dienelactone hydrolase